MARNKPRAFRPKPQFAAKPAKTADTKAVAEPLARRQGKRPDIAAPVFLETPPGPDYALLDSGDGARLERFGSMTIVRPESQAIWRPALKKTVWDNADALFTGDTDEEGMGRWRFKTPRDTETWPMAIMGVPFFGRFTAFRHVGVFAEQQPVWSQMETRIAALKAARPDKPVRVLNLFGYTGVASLIAAKAGADVTHIDASRKAIGWARENQTEAGLETAPIRWICEDASRFVAREIKRGKGYDIILCDPPAYGRGPKGEVWSLFDNLPQMIDDLRALLEHDGDALFLTAYAIRASFFTLGELVADRFTGLGGTITQGEMTVLEESAGRRLATSLYAVWSRS